MENIMRMYLPGDDLFTNMMYIFDDVFVDHSYTNGISLTIL